VGDLAPDVNDFVLQETFRTAYSSVRSAKVVTDLLTGRSKGYGFVRFSDEADRDRALTEMHGQYCSTRPMRVSLATAKKPQPAQAVLAMASPLSGHHQLPGMPSTSAHGDPFGTDSTNTTVFVGGLDGNVGEEELRSHFAPYGELVYVKIPAGTTREKSESCLLNIARLVDRKVPLSSSTTCTTVVRQWCLVCPLCQLWAECTLMCKKIVTVAFMGFRRSS
jgi:RNA recognition motif-containing protein